MKEVIVTGAGGGLGKHITKRLLEDKYRVHAPVQSANSEAELKNLFPEYDGKHLFISVVDVTKKAAVEKFIGKLTDITALVHLAGGFRGGKSIADYAEKDFDFLFDLHARATFHLICAVMPVFIKNNNGNIITIGAKPAVHPGAQNAVYAASKAAEISFTLTVAEEGRKNNIRANCIVPAVIKTPANEEGTPETEIAKWTPPEDIAEVISYLLSDAAKGVNGTVIPMYNKIPG
jgi:3-oxoacyl-[acyl-carrier protein] reductase